MSVIETGSFVPEGVEVDLVVFSRNDSASVESVCAFDEVVDFGQLLCKSKRVILFAVPVNLSYRW